MFNNIYYKIAKNTDSFVDVENDIFTWGVNHDLCDLSEELCHKINKGLKKIGEPWKELIPYYKNSFFVLNKIGIRYFLFNCCDLTIDNINEISNKYKLYKMEISCISNGLSFYRGTVFNDEISNVTEVNFDTLNNTCVNDISKPFVLNIDIKNCKDKYYNKFNFKINF